jgi:methylenetetrahydrofolate reductase (NADPH)
MWNMFRSSSLRSGTSTSSEAGSNLPVSMATTAVVANSFFELVPLKNLAEQVQHLPKGAKVSVTCSPAKGIEHTLALSAELQTQGFCPTPHIAARLVRDRAHAAEIAATIGSHGFDEMYLIAGDAEEAAGYAGAVEFLRDFVELESGVKRIGIAGYPDGHLFLNNDILRNALHDKQTILENAGIDGWVSTQMCFDPAAIANWIRAERANGLVLPIRLGIPGPIDRTKLLTMGMRVGVGQSLRYLQKNRSGLTKLMTASYDPSEVLAALGDLEALGINGLHLFSFNQLDSCAEWVAANS